MSLSNNFPAIRPSLLLDFANTQRLDPRITFTRTTTATYYDGVTTAKAEQNLHTYSQEIDDSAWQKGAVTVTANNTTAPDGTSTAELMAEADTSAVHILSGNASGNRPTVVSGQTYAFSVFLKKGTGATAPDIIQVSWGGAGFASNAYANFNLDTGVISSSGAGALTSTITAAGNGWYRCSLTATATSTVASSIGIMFVENDGAATRAPSYLGVTTADVFIWGAQLEQRSAVTAYTPTTTQPITNYIPVLQTAAAGVARFDHNPTTGESLGLLVEEQRTNLLTYSAEFDNAAWTKTRSSITANTIVAPDGTLTGDKLVEDTSTNTHYVLQSASFVAGTTYTITAYAKAAERSFFELVLLSAAFGGNVQAFFDLENGTVGSLDPDAQSQSITSVGNGWYRCALTAVATTTVSTNVHLRIADSISTDSYTGNGYSGIYIWGAQLEAGAFRTSYIPTTSATVTRNADAASMTGTNFSSWYRADEGSVYCEASTVSFAADRGAWAIGNNSLAFGSGNMMYEVYSSSLSGRRVTASFYNGVVQAQVGSAVSQTVNTFSKGIFVYKTNDFSQSTNGATVQTDTSGLVPLGVTGLSIGNLASGWSGATTYLNSTIKKLAYYPSRLTNAQLQALTS